MTNELRTNEPPAALLPVRWYVVANYGAATLCLDEADARKVAHECDLAWPANAPHVAVQLAPVALAAAPTPAALRDRLLVALERAASAETKLAALQIEYDKLTSTVASGEPTAEQWRSAIEACFCGSIDDAEWSRITALARSAVGLSAELGAGG